MNKKNLVFIMTDHQRADSINMIQDGKEVTPNLNKLAKESTVFTRAYNTCPLCVPARTALATGKFPTSNGVVLNKGSKPGDYKTIHQYLKDAGYEVAHVGIQHIRVKPDLKDRMDFDFWIDEEDYNNYAKGKSINTKRADENATEISELQNGKYTKKCYSNTRVTKWNHLLENFKDSYFCDKSIEFLRKKHDKPFALFVYFWAPHPPLIVPEPFKSMFNPDNIILPENVGKETKNQSETRIKSVPRQLAQGITIDHWKQVWAAHLGLVNLADKLIGKILNEIKNIGQENDTITLFTVDHGEHLGQHNMYQKMEMYEQAINIPFMIKVPQIKGKRFDQLVSHLDILPTILDMFNINYEGLDGDSLKESIINAKQPEDKDVFCQYSGNPALGDIRRAIINQKYKYIYDVIGSPELYDLEKDPLEMNNVASDKRYKDIETCLHNKCKEFFSTHGDWIKY